MRTKTIALAAGGALAVTTIGGVGVALAGPALATATSTLTSTEAPEVESDDATDGERQAAKAERIAEELAPLVEDGTITQAQADAVGEQLATSMGGNGGHGGKGGDGPGGVGHALETAAEALGLTADELQTQLQDGSTLGEVADAKGVDRDALVADLVAAAKTEVAARVADGSLTQEKADEILSTLEERVSGSLDRSLPDRGDRGPRGGDRDEDTSTPAPSTTPTS